jgi:hypothetical protein
MLFNLQKKEGNRMKKRIVTLLLISGIFVLSACRENTDTETSAVDTEVSTAESEAVSEAGKTEEKTAEVTERIEETEDSTENTAAEAEAEDTKASDSKAEDVEPAHTHLWDGGSVTQAATCIDNGVKTYTCSCGETKNETISAAGHNWVAQTTTVHHDSEGMYQQVKTGEQNVIYCNCGEVFYTDADSRAHDPYNDHGYTVRCKPVYETQWVETSPAWDETITTGYICSICGAAQ